MSEGSLVVVFCIELYVLHYTYTVYKNVNQYAAVHQIIVVLFLFLFKKTKETQRTFCYPEVTEICVLGW